MRPRFLETDLGATMSGGRVLLCALLLATSCGGARREPAAVADPPPDPPAASTPRVLALAGDAMLARLVTETIAARGPEWPVAPEVAALTRGADLAFVNLECVIAESGAPFQPPRAFSFRASPKA